MRLLHTSDWHLGRSFHRVSLLDAQAAFLDHLVRTVETRRIDAVLVSGDVYDRALPSLPAVELFDSVLHRLADLGVPTVIISGNHDSARRLGVAAGLIERAGVHLRTDLETCFRPVVLEDEHGEVAVYGIPYLEPGLVRETLEAERADHAAVLGAALDLVRTELSLHPPGTRSVVLAHAFVTGGEPSDSERDITAGGVASVPVSVFDGIDYVALGHLHGCQAVTERVRYSGSPLAYSFSEYLHTKVMLIVELGRDGSVATERIMCPVPRPVLRLRGRLEELLALPEHPAHQEAWIEVTLTDPHRPHDAMARLRARFPHTLALVFEPEGATGDGAASYAGRLKDRTDQQITEDFVTHVRGDAPGPEERALLGEALEEARIRLAGTESV
jgi:exonuclease SbcD